MTVDPSVHLGLNVKVGDRVEIATGTIVGANVTIGDDARIGIGCVIKANIGPGARVGCGAVVIHDIPAGEVHAGNPAQRIHHPGSAIRSQVLTAERIDDLTSA